MKHRVGCDVYPLRMKTRFFLMVMAASMVLPLSAETETPLGKQMDAMNGAIPKDRFER